MITVGIQTNVEIVSSSPARGKYSEKEYERLFIRESGMRARDGKMTYIRRDYHNRIRRIIRVIGHDRLSMSAYIDHVLTLHFGQSDEAIKACTRRIMKRNINHKNETMKRRQENRKCASEKHKSNINDGKRP